MNVRSNSWFAVYTKPRQEHTALLNLERQSFKCYLPMVERECRGGIAADKIRYEPLFPRYLFLNATPELQSLAAVRSTRGVVALVRAGCEPIKIPAPIIASLKASTDRTTGLIILNTIGLNSGDKVRVFDGPFANLDGIFKEHRGATRSMLLLEILGCETAVEIDARLLQRAG